MADFAKIFNFNNVAQNMTHVLACQVTYKQGIPLHLLNSEKVAASWSISSSCLVTPHLLLSQAKVAVDCKSAAEGGLEGKPRMCDCSAIISYSKNKAVENLVSLMFLFTQLFT